MTSLLSVRDLHVHYLTRSSRINRKAVVLRAVDGVSFDLQPGEILGLVGESGCGKSTLARAVIRLIEPVRGNIYFEGTDILSLRKRALREIRKAMQIVFQDPYASLNPRMTVGELIGEPWIIHPDIAPSDKQQAIGSLLSRVGLDPRDALRYPHQFSGGQRQRIVIARALALRPRLLICDEPTSALDVSVQAQVMNLLQDIQRDFDFASIFISHDLSVIRHIANRVAVMYLGRIVELGTVQDVFHNPTHPYTQALLSAAPVPDPSRKNRRRIILAGEVDSAANTAGGCRFRSRCWKAAELCVSEEPLLHPVATPDQLSACHFAESGEFAPSAKIDNGSR